MKPLSPAALALLEQIDHDLSFTDRLVGRAVERIEVLRELAAIAEPAMVPALIRPVFGKDRAISREAARALSAAIARASADDLWKLDVLCRRVWSSPRNDWSLLRLEPRAFERFEAHAEAESAVIGVASFHPSGYVREAAVTRLSAMRGAQVLSFLVLRLNDWVEEVATRARLAVDEQLAEGGARSLLTVLPLILRLESATRRKHDDLITAVQRALVDPAHRDILREGLRSPAAAVRRSLFRVALSRGAIDRTELLWLALADADPMVRLEAITVARRRFEPAELLRALDAVFADPYPAVRREGIQAAAERLGEGARTFLLGGAMDANRGVREVARFFVVRRGIVSDIATFYREALRDAESPRRLAVAIAGIGETGTRDDVQLIDPFLGHERSTVRRAAVRALATLDIEAALPRMLVLLGDPARGVAHAARDALAPHVSRVGPERLGALLREAPAPHTRFDALTLASALPKWDSLPLLLEALGDRDPRIRDATNRRITDWIANQNRTAAAPSPVQVTAIRRALDAVHTFADERIVREVRSMLQFWERTG